MIKILISLHTMPNIISYKQIIASQLIPELKKNTEVKVFWLIYMPDRINQVKQNITDEEILDIHDFNNAVEVIQKIKPDIIYSSPTVNLPDYALNLAAKYFGIPTIGEIMNDSVLTSNSKKVSKLLMKEFFQNTVPTDTIEEKKFLKRGRFFIFKYKFLLGTQKAIGIKIFNRIKNFFTLLRDISSEPIKGYNLNYSCTKHFLESELIMKQLIRNGFDRNSLIITGIPVHDPLFKRIEEMSKKTIKHEKKNILFVTHSLFEHGFQSREQRDYIVRGVIKEYSKIANEYSLTVKIHPSSENLSDYEAIIKPINPEIKIIKKGNILEYIEKADVVITYSTSTAPKQAILYKKPVIICNFFNLENDPLLERDLAHNCKKLEELVSYIEKSREVNLITENKLTNFVNEYFYRSDGNAGKRVCEMILEITNQTQ